MLNRQLSTLLLSECCNSKPFFAYGVTLTEEGSYIGLCGVCKEKTQFNMTIEKKEDYENL